MIKTGLLSKPSRRAYWLSVVFAQIHRNLTSDILPNPPYIDGFSFKNPITKKSPFANFYLGIYTHQKKRYVIKTWSGMKKDINYYLLVNEYNTNYIISRALTRMKKTGITVPTMVGYSQTTTQLSIISEYIDGTLLSNLSKKQQVSVFYQVAALIQQITKKLTAYEKRYFPLRSNEFYFFSFFALLFILVIRKQPKHYLYGNLFFKALRNFPFGTRSQYTLSHGDLNPDNMIVDKNMIYVLDGERFRLSVIDSDIYQGYIARGNQKIRSLMNKKNEMHVGSSRIFFQIYFCILFIVSTMHKPKVQQYYERILSTL